MKSSIVHRPRLRSIVAGLAVVLVGLSGMSMPAQALAQSGAQSGGDAAPAPSPASSSETARDTARDRARSASRVASEDTVITPFAAGDNSFRQGMEIDMYPPGWLGTFAAYAPGATGTQPYPGLCIRANAENPADYIAASPFELTANTVTPPADYRVDVPQMAYLMQRYLPREDTFNDQNLDAAAMGLLAHGNFEQGDGGQGRVDALIASVEADEPAIAARAREIAAEARASGAVGFEAGEVVGSGTRYGVINKIGVKNGSGNFITGKPFTITLTGPAVFTSTGTNVYASTTASTAVDGIEWQSTGTGKATYSVRYDDLGASKLIGARPDSEDRQQVLYDVKGALSRTLEGPTWDVVFDFQPMLTSSVSAADSVQVGPGESVFSDSLDVFADPNYAGKDWLGEGLTLPTDAGYTPLKVTFTGTLYKVAGERPVGELASVPSDAEVLGSTQVVAAGPGTYPASITVDDMAADDPGFFAVWVWKVDKTDQPQIAAADLVAIHDDWSDVFGIEDEQSVKTWNGLVESNLKAHATIKNTYLVDDVWVSGFPTDYPDFEGGFGFGADTKTMTMTLYFWADGTSADDISKAEVIGSMTVPAKNGFYPSQGGTNFKLKLDEAGNPVPGTYQMVHELKAEANGRVASFVSPVPDTFEQYVVTAAPTIGTTATGDTDGMINAAKDATITDTVCYTGLAVGKDYRLSGTLMDKSTGKPLLVGGKKVTATQAFTADKANGCENVTFTFDSTGLRGKDLVVFEDLYRGDVLVGTHADLADKGQTVTVPPLATPSTGELAHTGATPMGIAMGIAGVALMGLGGAAALAAKRREQV